MYRLMSLWMIVLLAAGWVSATAQQPDFLVYDGEKHMLQTNPMEEYFRQHPDKKPTSGVMSTALWRGYVATFEVREGRLLLKDIEVMIPSDNADRGYVFKSERSTIVPAGAELELDWFTGILVLPHGRLVSYVHMGYASAYEKYILLEVKKGRITGERRLKAEGYEAFKEKQFQAFKRTDAYAAQAARLRQDGLSEQRIDSYLRVGIIGYTSEFLDEIEGAEADETKPTTVEAERK